MISRRILVGCGDLQRWPFLALGSAVLRDPGQSSEGGSSSPLMGPISGISATSLMLATVLIPGMERRRVAISDRRTPLAMARANQGCGVGWANCTPQANGDDDVETGGKDIGPVSTELDDPRQIGAAAAAANLKLQ